MNIQDLLALLRDEFSLDIDMSRQAVSQAVAQPEQAAVLLEPMVSYIERSVQASSLVGLEGWGQYLSQVSQLAQLQMMQADVPSLKWLVNWTDPALAYLQAPAQERSTDAIIHYLQACPQETDAQALSQLRQLLMKAPSLLEGDALAAQALVEPATTEDVSLAMDEVDSGLLSALLQDAPDQLERLESILNQLQIGSVPADRLVEAQRIAHTFKGSGNIIGLPGIGRVSHRLEDVMEWTLERVQQGQAAHLPAVRDMLYSVGVLQQMVGFLQGEEEQPSHALVCLQRLIDWCNWISQDEALEQNPTPLQETEGTAGVNSSTASAIELEASPAHSKLANASNTPKDTPEIGTDAQTLRIGVDRISRVLRRATQSIVASQRVAQLVRNANERLSAIDLSHIELERRLRELEQTVDKQVVQLRGQKEAGEGFDPLEMDRYDALYSLSRFVSEAVQDQLQLARDARTQVKAAASLLRDEEQLQREQHRELLNTRLVPVKTIVARLKRNVAQTAASTGKKAQLIVQGETTTLDSDVLTRLTEPLLHLLRNAVDHGLEEPKERKYLKKPETGTVTLSFRRVGQEVELVCSDDGKGLDLPTIYDKAIEYGLIAQDAELSEDEMRRLILRPGFSTKGQVTEVSGRGVGMDVVNDRVTGLKGRLEIASVPFEGSRFTIRVPVSTGAAQALIAQTADNQVALFAEQVVQALAADEAVIETNAQGHTLQARGHSYPLYSLAQWLGFEDQPSFESRSKPAIVVRGSSGEFALQVDAVLDARELILQDIGRLTRRISGVVGGALRNDGLPMFLLDVAALERAQQAQAKGLNKASSSLAMRRRQTVQRTRILVVDDALSVRRSMQQLLEDAGYDVALAADGFLALESLRDKPPAIVLTDLEMPNLNGLELTKRLRELPQFMGLPVVMITSRASDKHRDLAMEAGVDVYLTKPYTDAHLIEQVKRLTTQETQLLMS